MTSSVPSTTYVSAEEPVYATMYDVVIFDSACLETTPCTGDRIEHLVEYYGADWCEPCELIEHEIEQLNRTDTFVMQHHPSVLDTSFLSASKLRFYDEHRLLFLPSLVINSEGLLTGSSQALELPNVLSERSTSFEGFTDLELGNESLTWQASQGDKVSVWRTEAVEHPERNRTHPTLATDVRVFNASNGSGNVSSLLQDWNGSLVVMLERSGVYLLESDSSNPTGGFDLNVDEEQSQVLSQKMSPGVTASLWTVILIACLLPAIYMRWNLSKQHSEEEE